jgi:hypothetical protein
MILKGFLFPLLDPLLNVFNRKMGYFIHPIEIKGVYDV